MGPAGGGRVEQELPGGTWRGGQGGEHHTGGCELLQPGREARAHRPRGPLLLEASRSRRGTTSLRPGCARAPSHAITSERRRAQCRGTAPRLSEQKHLTCVRSALACLKLSPTVMLRQQCK